MTTKHGIPAASWQLQMAAEQKLRAIVLPLLPEIETDEMGWKYWRSNVYETTLAFAPSEKPFAYPGSYTQLRYQKGDREFLLWVEPSCEVSEHEAEWLNWQSVETMPQEAARHWFKVTEIRVIQAINLTAKDLRLSGLYSLGAENGKNVDEVISLRWNLAYPNQPWHSDRWVIVLAVEATHG
jgi:hypothetical protein